MKWKHELKEEKTTFKENWKTYFQINMMMMIMKPKIFLFIQHSEAEEEVN
jgi:hypothetical protein